MARIKGTLEIDIVAPVIGPPHQRIKLVRGWRGSLAHTVFLFNHEPLAK
jgi:hypothetical protein